MCCLSVPSFAFLLVKQKLSNRQPQTNSRHLSSFQVRREGRHGVRREDQDEEGFALHLSSSVVGALALRVEYLLNYKFVNQEGHRDRDWGYGRGSLSVP